MGLTEREVNRYMAVNALSSVRINNFMGDWVVEFVGSGGADWYLKTARSENARAFKSVDSALSVVRSFGFRAVSVYF